MTGPLLACLPSEITVPPDSEEQLRERGQVRLIWPDPETPVDRH